MDFPKNQTAPKNGANPKGKMKMQNTKPNKEEMIKNLKTIALHSVQLLDKSKKIATDFDKIKCNLFISYNTLFKNVYGIACETLTYSESKKKRQAINGLFTLEMNKQQKSKVLDLIKKAKSKHYSEDGKKALGLWKETEETELPKGTLANCLKLLRPEIEKLTEKQIAVLAKELTSKRLKDIK